MFLEFRFKRTAALDKVDPKAQAECKIDPVKVAAVFRIEERCVIVADGRRYEVDMSYEAASEKIEWGRQQARREESEELASVLDGFANRLDEVIMRTLVR